MGPDQRFEAYRAVHVPDRDDPALAHSFRSHYEMGLRPQPLEEDRTSIYMAVSFWRDDRKVVHFARKVGLEKFGRYLARLELGYGFGFEFLDPELERNPRHLTIWGTRDKLAQAVVDIVPIDPA